MASRRTTIVLSPEEDRALREASKREGVSQSELIRRGIRTVTSSYSKRPKHPATGWLKLTRAEERAILADRGGDRDER